MLDTHCIKGYLAKENRKEGSSMLTMLEFFLFIVPLKTNITFKEEKVWLICQKTATRN